MNCVEYNKGNLFLIVGPSGVGKNTLINELLQIKNNIHFVPSITTRPMRITESEGKPYYFVNKQEFINKIYTNEFLEWQQVHGNYYGSSLKIIEEILNNGIDAITDMEILGAHDALLRMPSDVCTIFISPPSKKVLINRILSRQKESPKEIESRMARADFEMSLAGLFDFMICNDKLDVCLNSLQSIIKAQRAKRYLQNYMELNNEPLVLRTVVFEFRSDKDNSSTKLPKTIISDFETYEICLKRLLKMIGFQSNLFISVDAFNISKKAESVIKKEKYRKYVEWKTCCEIVSNSKSETNKLLNAIQTIGRKKGLEK